MIRIFAEDIEPDTGTPLRPDDESPHGPPPEHIPLADEEDEAGLIKEEPSEPPEPPAFPQEPLLPMPEAEPLPPPEDLPGALEGFESIQQEPSELDEYNRSHSISEKLNRAIYEQRYVEIAYTTKKGFQTQRLVEPAFRDIAKTTHNDILTAWDHLRSDWRGFIVTRISEATVGDEHEDIRI